MLTIAVGKYTTSYYHHLQANDNPNKYHCRLAWDQVDDTCFRSDTGFTFSDIESATKALADVCADIAKLKQAADVLDRQGWAPADATQKALAESIDLAEVLSWGIAEAVKPHTEDEFISYDSELPFDDDIAIGNDIANAVMRAECLKAATGRKVEGNPTDGLFTVGG